MTAAGSFFVAHDEGPDSALIRWWSSFTAWIETRIWKKSRWDHCGVIIGDDGATLEARADGLSVYNIHRYDATPDRIKIWTPKELVISAAVVIQAATFYDIVGNEAYPFLQTFVGIPITWIARKVFRLRRFRNPFGAGVDCVEVAVKVARRAGIDIDGMDENTTPEEFARWANGNPIFVLALEL